MRKYIDAEAFKEWIENWFYKHKSYHPYAKTNTIPITELYDLLEQMPAADVVEVVRCKDCQYAKPHNCEFWIAEAPLICGRFDIYVGDDDYCSNGERKGSIALGISIGTLIMSGGRKMSEKITVKDIVDIYEKVTNCDTRWVARYINLEDDDTR